MEQFKVAHRPRPGARRVPRHRPGAHRHPRRPDAGAVPGLAAGFPHIKAGKLRPLAVTGVARHALLPDVPTFEELGYKGFDGVQWYGIVGPANLPPAVVTTLNTEINKMLADPQFKDRLSGEALEVMPMAPAQFGQYMRDDIAKWTRVAKERNIEIND
jgi:tripartite-type tricarboxylate transporter receptor subunit TctC